MGAIARMYCELHVLEPVCLRIWLSHRDLVQRVRKNLLAEVRFAIYYGVSNNRNRLWDISSAR